jgi:hypothetical protein
VAKECEDNKLFDDTMSWFYITDHTDHSSFVWLEVVVVEEVGEDVCALLGRR